MERSLHGYSMLGALEVNIDLRHVNHIRYFYYVL